MSINFFVAKANEEKTLFQNHYCQHLRAAYDALLTDDDNADFAGKVMTSCCIHFMAF